MMRRYRLPEWPAAASGTVMCVSRLQSFDGSGHHRGRSVEVRIADTQDDYVFATLLRCARQGVCLPCISAFTADPINQGRKLHWCVYSLLQREMIHDRCWYARRPKAWSGSQPLF